MLWSAVGAIAELLGALGVILSLVYLASQVRSSGRMSRQESARSVLGKMNTALSQLTADNAVAEVWNRGSKGLSHLENDGERTQYAALVLSVFRTYEELHFYRQDGLEWDWAGFDAQINDVLATAGAREWWARRGHWFSKSFRDDIGSRLGAAAQSEYPPLEG